MKIFVVFFEQLWFCIMFKNVYMMFINFFLYLVRPVVNYLLIFLYFVFQVVVNIILFDKTLQLFIWDGFVDLY